MKNCNCSLPYEECCGARANSTGRYWFTPYFPAPGIQWHPPAEPHVSRGWQCPVCKSVYSPTWFECTNCRKEAQENA